MSDCSTESTADSPEVRGRIKSFNPYKGYGLVSLDDGREAFLHISDVTAANIKGMPSDGASIICTVKDAPKGLRVSRVISVERTSEVRVARTVVLWFDDTKGFGFLRDERGGDIFVPMAALHRSGLATLDRGQSIEAYVCDTPRGKQAKAVRKID